MAHECPDCGQVCYCNGDIDDCLLNDEDAELHCDHYKQCQMGPLADAHDELIEDDDDFFRDEVEVKK